MMDSPGWKRELADYLCPVLKETNQKLTFPDTVCPCVCVFVSSHNGELIC